MTKDVLDLGDLTGGPLLFFGGPYSNLHATKALFDKAGALGIPQERMICTGDIAAYCAHPDETATLIRNSDIYCIAGNCDENLAEGADNCGCGFDAGSACETNAVKWYEYMKGKTSPDNARWMGTLPKSIRLVYEGKTILVIHGSPVIINEFVFKSTDQSHKQKYFDDTGADIIIGGHCGLAFTDALPSGKIWHNAGVIGMPANDGTPRTWFSIFDGKTMKHMPLEYDYEAEAAAVDQAGHAPIYAKTLRTGLWDNCDILPQEETQMAGHRLEFEEIRFE